MPIVPIAIPKQASKQASAPLTQEQLRAQLRQMLREELRALFADPQAFRALLFPSHALPSRAREQAVPINEGPVLSAREVPSLTALLPFAGGACPTLGNGPNPSTSNRLAKWSDGSCNMANSVLFDDGTNLAIGTTTPNATFDIHTTNPAVMLSGSGAAFVLADGSWVVQGRFGSETGASAGPFVSSDVSGHVLKFYMNAGSGLAEGMRITSDGKVGIGTMSPAQLLDVAGNVNAQGLIGPPRMLIQQASFATAAGEDHGSATFAAGDGGMEAQTGTTTGSYDDTLGGLITDNSPTGTTGIGAGLNRTGAFLSTRARWNSSSIGSSDVFYILAGGLGSSGAKKYGGFGFKARDASGTKKLYGVVTVSGTDHEADLSTTPTTGTWFDLWAVCRGSSVDFYVNGVYKATANTTPPSSADSTYEVYVENGGGTNNAILQVAYLAVGFPFAN